MRNAAATLEAFFFGAARNTRRGRVADHYRATALDRIPARMDESFILWRIQRDRYSEIVLDRKHRRQNASSLRWISFKSGTGKKIC